MSNTRLKIDLYILSLGLLFFFLIILTTKLPDGPLIISTRAWWIALATINPISIISATLLAYCVYVYKKFAFDIIKGAPDIPFEVKKIKGINYEHLIFLATYVVPLIGFDFKNGQYMFVFCLLLIVMGVIYIKTDLFYQNPSLALLGFHIFQADGNFKNGDRAEIILISRGRIVVGQKVYYIKLDERIYYVKGTSA